MIGEITITVHGLTPAEYLSGMSQAKAYCDSVGARCCSLFFHGMWGFYGSGGPSDPRLVSVRAYCEDTVIPGGWGASPPVPVYEPTTMMCN
jgi:hypothetical protein